jgi:hypothetical protein
MDPDKFWSKVDRSDPDGCWPWTGLVDKDGYGKVRNNGRDTRTHQFAYALTFGNLPDDLPCVCHRCNNPPCCRPDHLYADTNAGNIRYRNSLGRHPHGDTHWTRLHPERLPRGDAHPTRLHPETVTRGEKHPRATLTEALVLKIMEMSAKGDKPKRIATTLGLNRSTVAHVIKGRVWRHVTHLPHQPAQI